MAVAEAIPNTAKNQRKEIIAWCLYDWANSAYSTIQITVLVDYLVNRIALPDKMGALIYGWGIGVTMIVTAFLSPVLGAIADARANKRTWLAGATLVAAGSCALMWFATPDRPWLFVALFILANLGYEQAWGFYNAFLPEIADDKYMSRVSSWGFGTGYVGGGVLLLIAVVMFFQGDAWGIPSENGFRFRLSLLLMGLWWGVFSLPMLLIVKDKRLPSREPQPLLATGKQALADVWSTLRHLRRYRMLVIFLVGFLIYNDGVQTMITQASVFATDVLDMQTSELGGVILMIQFVALPGALTVGWLADRIGQKPALMMCLGIWVTLLVCAFFITEKWQFWTMAAFAALVLGGTQSVSRTIMGLMTPESRAAEFFGFFNLSGKAASMLGPIVFSTTMYATGSAHYAILSLLGFFLLGWGIILPLNIKQGQAVARANEAGTPVQ
ncbi:MAG: MFS transporter [Pirellulales bacterium]